MEKLKVLMATDSFLPRWDGVARFLNEVLPRIALDFEITVLAPEFLGTFKPYEHINVKRLKLSSRVFGDYTPARFHYREIKKEVSRADVVWTHALGPIGALAMFEAKRQGKPLIANIHIFEWELVHKSPGFNPLVSAIVYFVVRHFARFMYNRCDLIFVPSIEVAEILSFEKINANKRIIHLGVDHQKFVPPESKPDAKRLIGLNPEKVVIGYFGRLGREKDLLTLYRAYMRLRKTHESKVHLLVVGSGVPAVENIFRNKPGITYVPSQDDIVPYIQAMDIYCLTSLTETTSLSTLEAMSCEVAVIATPVGAVAEYVKHGKNGLLFSREDKYTLFTSMRQLADDPALRESLGSNGRKTVLYRFSWDLTVEEIKEVLKLY